jgi:hypothetical protein
MNREEYLSFLTTKELKSTPVGFDIDRDMLDLRLFEYQKDIIKWACKRGRSAIWAGCGMGKTVMALKWANFVVGHCGEGTAVLILTPVAVGPQFIEEAQKFGIDNVRIVESAEDVRAGINITNYQKLHKFTPDHFTGIVIDESSILRSFTGTVKQQLIDFAETIPYRLSCSATPAPNDHVELGNQAEFLSVMKRKDMLSSFFTHDSGDTGSWLLKGHAKQAFWKWVCSWAVCITRPSDLGYQDAGFELPPIHYHEVLVDSGEEFAHLFGVREAVGIKEQNKAKLQSLKEKVKVVSDLIANSEDQWIVWCNLNAESSEIANAVPTITEVTGTDTDSVKEDRLYGFMKGKYKDLVTKSVIAGYGLNLQNCHNMVMFGLSNSFEQIFQATRRCWRYGQKNPVNVYIVTSLAEAGIVRNIERKEKQFNEMIEGMVTYMKDEMQLEVRGSMIQRNDYNPQVEMSIPSWLVSY